ncbi:hypothetical protein A2125_00675 [Candidatus Woesebacteria bacterium GWB1_43_5]|uniref:Uncharacterized protein n=1 Tax=Candidatus Woesebacteria bacterium GWB1_43_5 TaxID=1802474 RepID=A0A1F7WRQ5_9BACT|nr:MAG: hypothetical protein A2125_00675 [Candidatus Woesebacteria bacterium GWB1_43_5]
MIDLDELNCYSWTSFPYYLSVEVAENSFVNSNFIIKIVGSRERYVEFVRNQSDYQRQLKIIKDLLLE